MIIDDNHPDFFVDSARSQDSVPAHPGDTIQFDSGAAAQEQGGKAGKPNRWRRVLAMLALVCVLALSIVFWIRYLNPYATDCRMSGYVTGVEKRGIIFKTYEADIISEKALTDTVRLYSHDESFSVADAAVVKSLRQYQGTGLPVELVYEKYYGTLPWRGASKSVILAVRPVEDQ